MNKITLSALLFSALMISSALFAEEGAMAKNAVCINPANNVYGIFDFSYERVLGDYFSILINPLIAPRFQWAVSSHLQVYGGALEGRFYFQTGAPKDFYVGLYVGGLVFTGQDDLSNFGAPGWKAVSSGYSIALGGRLGTKILFFGYSGLYLEPYIGLNVDFGPGFIVNYYDPHGKSYDISNGWVTDGYQVKSLPSFMTDVALGLNIGWAF